MKKSDFSIRAFPVYGFDEGYIEVDIFAFEFKRCRENILSGAFRFARVG